MRLYPADVRGGYVVDHLAAGGAVPPSLEGRAARTVGRQSSIRVTVAHGPVGSRPLGEHPEGAGEVGTRRSQPIGMPNGTVRVGLAHDQAVGLEAGKTIGQDVGRDPVKVGEQVAESAGARQQCGDDQQRPPAGDDVSRDSRVAIRTVKVQCRLVTCRLLLTSPKLTRRLP